MRIKFLTNGPVQNFGSNTRALNDTEYRIVVNPAYFMMKHYHTLHGKHQPTWLIQDFIANSTAHEQVDSLVRDRVELLLLPCFVWNMDLQMEIAKLYRERVPHGHVVAGGPQLTAHKDSDFFQKYPQLDYVVYGDGEKALSDIIDYLATGDRSSWVNTIENVQGKAHVWPFQVLRDEKYWSTSPYLHQKQFIRDSLESLYAQGYTNNQIMIGVEFARGCMYKCAYCDWSQNLTKKVTRRKAEWKRELEFFRDLDISIRETDANFGSWKEDIEIYDYAKSLYNPDRNFKFLVWNTAKLKQNAHHFMIGNAETYGKPIVFSFEDTEKVVLKAMQRPSLTWKQHQEMIAKIRHRLGKERFAELTIAELMLGMPKQSLETFKENFKKIIGEGITKIMLSHWALLPNSPGADPTYLQGHGVEFKEHRLLQGRNSDNPGAPDSIDELYRTAQTIPHFVRQSMVYRTNDMEYVDIITVTIAGSLLESHIMKKAVLLGRLSNISATMDWLFEFSAKKARLIVAQHKDAIEKYGFVVPGQIHENMFISGWSENSLIKFEINEHVH